MKKDYYEVLGISKTADKKAIKKAYRELAKKYHPDKNKATDAESKFKEVQEAYDILSDDQQRKAYDQFGHAGTQGFGGFGAGGFGGQGGFGGSYQAAGFEDLGDILNQFFGGDSGFGGFGFGGQDARGRRSGKSRGSDIEVILKLDFNEAIFGIEKTIRYKHTTPCEKCNATGAKNGTSKKQCTECSGSGYIRQIQNTFLGQIQTQAICPTCKGTGEMIETPCEVCKGKTFVEKEEDFKIKIPAGIPDGVTLRFREKGNAGANGGTVGDLFVTIEVKAHEQMERRGDDIYVDQTIDVVTATLGGDVIIPSVNGKLSMKVPAGTQPDKIFKLTGKAGPRFRGNGNGDQYVRIKVQIPEKLSREEKKLWEQLKNV